MTERKAGRIAPGFPALYAGIYALMVEVGREHGYAMALHGSLARDLDVIAVPWTEDARPAEELVRAVTDRLEAMSLEDFGHPPEKAVGIKPHGRRVWNIVLSGQAFIDLSVMPRTPKQDNTHE